MMSPTLLLLLSSQTPIPPSNSNTPHLTQSQTVQAQGPQETGFNNSCLFEGRRRQAGPRKLDCAKFVVESTDKIWNMYRDPATVEKYIRQYMADDWESISVLGEYVRGLEAVLDGKRSTRLLAVEGSGWRGECSTGQSAYKVTRTKMQCVSC